MIASRWALAPDDVFSVVSLEEIHAEEPFRDELVARVLAAVQPA